MLFCRFDTFGVFHASIRNFFVNGIHNLKKLGYNKIKANPIFSARTNTGSKMGGILIKSSAVRYHPSYVFQNSMHSNLCFDDVFKNMLEFIEQAPHYEYRLSIGSDSQVTSKSTILVTAIHLHRVSRGAIGFICKNTIQRPIKSLREKIYYETAKTLEIASLFTPDKIDRIVSSLIHHYGKPGDIHFEFHLDVGNRGATRELINEMVAMAKGTIFIPKIKPDSYAASSYANRYTKDPSL